MNRTDSICAISTAPGVGGVAMIRISGKQGKPLVEQIAIKSDNCPITLTPRYATYAHLYDEKEFIDEVIITYYNEQHSYTGEEVIEISCHGSLYIQQRIIEMLLSKGIRLAEAGEFTMRAFLNGRLNLSEAEAIGDLIASRTKSEHRLAISQLRGGYAQKLETLRKQLIDFTALLELELDFSDEDIEFANRRHLKALLDEIKGQINQLLDSFHQGNAIKNGIPIAIVGKPNAGKSSLLNALLNDNRAIVSDIPGTTRDTLEDQLIIDGQRYRIIDTAGLRQSSDQIEKEGVKRSYQTVNQAQIVLYVATCQDDDLEQQLANLHQACSLQEKDVILILNKKDISSPTPIQTNIINCKTISFLTISAKNEEGIEELKKIIAQQYSRTVHTEGTLLSNLRHYEAMKKILEALNEADLGLKANLSPDLLTIDLHDALYHIGTITGQITNNDVLSSVFSNFCIGK